MVGLAGPRVRSHGWGRAQTVALQPGVGTNQCLRCLWSVFRPGDMTTSALSYEHFAASKNCTLLCVVVVCLVCVLFDGTAHRASPRFPSLPLEPSRRNTVTRLLLGKTSGRISPMPRCRHSCRINSVNIERPSWLFVTFLCHAGSMHET